MRLVSSLAISAALLVTACDATTSSSSPTATTTTATAAAPQITFDEAQLLTDLRILAADDMEGRGTGTAGSERARAYIISRFEEIGIEMIGDSYEHDFEYNGRRDPSATYNGTNVVGRIEGTSDSDRTMVLTAHYDHLGMRNGEIWNGADDNASGVAAMLATATDFIANPPEHDVVVVAFDAEERGLQGARAFVANPPIDSDDITFNLNLDMIAMSEDRILWVVGTYHYPFLMPMVEEVQTRALVNLPTGFDEPSDEPGADWTPLSDQGAFHEVGIPVIYLGVDFHPHYHQPSDIYENMTLDFFADATRTIIDFAREADERLDEIGDAGGR
ncbi:MAG: M28 family peptidase [Maricaulis sp.]|nr:M28 family peptidase [Maricaulis sp.]